MPNDALSPADPKALRALAHPLRWKLLDLVGSENTATATRCAAVLRESVASCSYHLGILGKYGYLEQVTGQPGRERPWRVARWRQVMDTRSPDPDMRLAAEAAMDVFLDHEFARTRARARGASLEPEAWRPAMSGTTSWLSEEEFATVKAALDAVMEPFGGRLEDPSRRPAGGRQVRIFYTASATPGPAGG
jgi:hypothetical protein